MTIYAYVGYLQRSYAECQRTGETWRIKSFNQYIKGRTHGGQTEER